MQGGAACPGATNATGTIPIGLRIDALRGVMHGLRRRSFACDGGKSQVRASHPGFLCYTALHGPLGDERPCLSGRRLARNWPDTFLV